MKCHLLVTFAMTGADLVISMHGVIPASHKVCRESHAAASCALVPTVFGALLLFVCLPGKLVF